MTVVTTKASSFLGVTPLIVLFPFLGCSAKLG